MSAGNPPTPPTPPAPPAPAPGSPWASLPEDLRSNPVVTRHKDVASLVREHIGAQDLIGRKGVILPKNWDDAADVARWNKEIGVPEKADGYDLSKIEVSEDWNDELGEEMIGVMHGLGLTERQVQGVLTKYAEIMDGVIGGADEAAKAAHAKADAELKTRWGHAYEEKVRRASTLFHNAWGKTSEELRTLRLQDGSMLGDHPAFLHGLSELADALGKEHPLLGVKETGRLTKTPDEARAEWATKQANKDFMTALMDKNHPEHGAAVQVRDALYRAMEQAPA